MVTNKYEVIIGKINYTHYCVMPLKGANLLDERLDEVYLPLRHIPVEVFQPLTPVKIIIHNKVHFNENVAYSKDKTLYFVIANDNNVVESPVGSGRFNHDIYLVETSKIAECIIVDSLTFTNDLGRNYAKNPKPIIPTEVTGTHQPKVPDTYVTPILSGESFTFTSVKDIYGTIADDNAAMSITFPNGEIIYPPDPYNNSYTVSKLENGIYNVGYSFSRDSDARKGSCDFIFTVVDNYYPLKRWTMKDVINRLLMLAKNLYEGETPEIVLDETQAELFDKIYAPEMSFTQKTLRECLQDCGSIIHGEPRLTPIEGATSAPFYTLTYDMYGGTERSNINVVPYITKTVSQTINGYCTSIDSNAQNLVNQLNYLDASQGGGTLTEPYAGGYKTLRTETLYIRVTDSNGIIATQYPIYAVEKLMCGYIPPTGTQKNIDITPYLFESTEYNSQLSSYKEDFPFSKAYGLFYTQGQKNIGGLNYKVEDAISTSLFSRYSIVNILRKATGDEGLDIGSDNFPILAFQITYKPIYSVRLSQTKPYYPEYKRQADLIYNQQSNLMETLYYGENLKGVVARLGTVEKTYTYLLSRWSLVPKAGQMFDDDYYIAAVSWELQATFIKVTLGLSKDFNRLSEYVGVSSNKRLYEVSERQAYERNILYREYMVYGDKETADENSLIGLDGIKAIYSTFINDGTTIAPLNYVIAWGGTYNIPRLTDDEDSPLPCVQLPVIASALGNSMVFSWRYEDNYSAGAQTNYAVIDGKDNKQITGYWQDDTPYCDYYGKMYYYNFMVQKSGRNATNIDLQTDIGTSLPKFDLPSAINDAPEFIRTLSPYIIRKDSREVLQVNAQIENVTNRKNMIIGSALASCCPLVRGADENLQPKAYVFDERLNKFINHVEGSINVNLAELTPADITAAPPTDGQFTVSFVAPVSGKSWAIVTKQTTKTVEVEDETGEVTEQVQVKGGDVLIGANEEVTAGQTITFYATKKHKIFER